MFTCFFDFAYFLLTCLLTFSILRTVLHTFYLLFYCFFCLYFICLSLLGGLMSLLTMFLCRTLSLRNVCLLFYLISFFIRGATQTYKHKLCFQVFSALLFFQYFLLAVLSFWICEKRLFVRVYLIFSPCFFFVHLFACCVLSFCLSLYYSLEI